MTRASTFTLLALASLGSVLASTPLVKEYSGSTFFDDWTYYGNYDNTTLGDVEFVNKSVATSNPELTYETSSGTNIIRVDNSSTVAYNYKRNSVRLTSTATYDVGTIIIFDAVHLPYGCSVWPAFWTTETVDWPKYGEIDIVEGVNNQASNQMALHTEDGCSLASSSSSTVAYSGIVNDTSCYYSDNDNSGCGVTESQSNSYGEAFAKAGGGVWVTELASSGISIWFFSRDDVPSVVSNASSTFSTDSLGEPSAYWGNSTCNIDKFFGAQHLIFDITLCGDWAGNVLSTTGCAALSGSATCYTTYVLDASNYDNAYFEVNSIKVYSNSSSTSNSSSSASSSGAIATAPFSGKRAIGVALGVGALGLLAMLSL